MTRHSAVLVGLTMLLGATVAWALPVAVPSQPMVAVSHADAAAATLADTSVKEALVLGCVWAALVGAACLAPFLHRRHRIMGIAVIMCLAVNLILLLGVAGLGKAPAATGQADPNEITCTDDAHG